MFSFNVEMQSLQVIITSIIEETHWNLSKIKFHDILTFYRFISYENHTTDYPGIIFILQ